MQSMQHITIFLFHHTTKRTLMTFGTPLVLHANNHIRRFRVVLLHLLSAAPSILPFGGRAARASRSCSGQKCQQSETISDPHPLKKNDKNIVLNTAKHNTYSFPRPALSLCTSNLSSLSVAWSSSGNLSVFTFFSAL